MRDESIYELFELVRTHPDFRAGAIFTVDDDLACAATDENRKRIEEAMTGAGFDAATAACDAWRVSGPPPPPPPELRRDQSGTRDEYDRYIDRQIERIREQAESPFEQVFGQGDVRLLLGVIDRLRGIPSDPSGCGEEPGISGVSR